MRFSVVAGAMLRAIVKDFRNVEAAMDITYQCEGCGRRHYVSRAKVGRSIKCDDCGVRTIVPNAPDVWGVEDYEAPSPGVYGVFDRETDATPSQPSPSRLPSLTEQASKQNWRGIGGVLAVLIVFSKIGMRAVMNPPWAKKPPPPVARVNAEPKSVIRQLAGDLDGPIALPSFPNPGPGREIEPGVILHEIKLGEPNPPIDAPAGHGGKLWLYLPKGEHAARSLPCALIAPAGSNFLRGMALADGDRPEHAPYAREGFAVLAFELDGGETLPTNPRDEEIYRARGLGGFGNPPFRTSVKFLKARAGLVNGRIALEYLFAKVPEVDPKRIFVVGHSSAATFAILFAENEPRLKGCVAYAPAVDVAARVAPRMQNVFVHYGLEALYTRFSPRTSESKLTCPIFLFHSKQDEKIPFSETQELADRLKGLGKEFTLSIANDGDHYGSMIRRGIPEGIAWLKTIQTR